MQSLASRSGISSWPRCARHSLLVRMASSEGFTYKWPRPAVTVDIMILTVAEETAKILLIERANDPFKGSFALPGGFVDKDEDLDAAAARELKEETHVSDVPLTQFGAFGKPGRDPRGHTVTVAYYGALAASSLDSVQADDDAASAKWLPLADVPSSSFAFDHADVVKQGLKRMTEDLAAGRAQGELAQPAVAAPLAKQAAAVLQELDART